MLRRLRRRAVQRRRRTGRRAPVPALRQRGAAAGRGVDGVLVEFDARLPARRLHRQRRPHGLPFLGHVTPSLRVHLEGLCSVLPLSGCRPLSNCAVGSRRLEVHSQRNHFGSVTRDCAPFEAYLEHCTPSRSSVATGRQLSLDESPVRPLQVSLVSSSNSSHRHVCYNSDVNVLEYDVSSLIRHLNCP